jgi:hypothetical protein
MTLTVLKSQIGGFDFPAAVESFRQELLEHRFTVDVPAPTAHPMIEGAVRRVPVEGSADDFIADFEIVDDTPPPPTLEERKAGLVGALALAEASAHDAVMSAGKLRLLSLDANDASNRISHARVKGHGDGAAEDHATVARFVGINERRAVIARHAASVHAAIDDLTADQVDAFQIPAFPQ